MATEIITFTCPACRTELTVPASSAGITGPCPICRSVIQAPYPNSLSVITPLITSIPEVLDPILENGTSRLEPTPIASPQDHLTPPPLQDRVIVEPVISSSITPAILRPEPRLLPSRSIVSEPTAKPMSDANIAGQDAKERHPRSKSRFVRILILLLFFLIAGALIFGVLTFLNNKPKPNVPEKTPSPSALLPIFPKNDKLILATHESGGNRTPNLPLTEAQEKKDITPASAAIEVLEKFLSAKTLAERLPYIETQMSEMNLSDSCLATSLPITNKIELDSQETKKVEEVIDFYYHVDFLIEGQQESLQMILVRLRGTGDPKVVVDPFLDTFGGRLACYAKTPSDKAGVFQTTVSAVAFCNDEHVPNREKKMTLKFLPRDGAPEITRAYFGKHSKIAEMLENETYSLSYEKTQACTVMLSWNTEENPSMPYLEALTLKTLD